MHELFITAVVASDLVGEILQILQGLCAMTPIHKFERRLVFEGPKAPPLVGIAGLQLQGRKPINLPLWKELHEQLVRQSYYLTASYELDEAQLRGYHPNEGVTINSEKTVVDPNESKGTLHFVDNPDPQGARPVNSRLAIYIKDEPHLMDLLRQINYTYSAEQIREAYYAYKDNVILHLFRDLRRTKQTKSDIPGGHSHAIPGSLPSFEDLQPFDAENKWVLTALVQVSDGNQPLLMQTGLDQLAQIKQDFAGIVEFVIIPRRQLDTRVLSYNQSIRS